VCVKQLQTEITCLGNSESKMLGKMTYTSSYKKFLNVEADTY